MLAKTLRELRKTRGLTQQDISELVGVSPQAVGKWERSESEPNTEALKKLSSFFGVSTDYMLGKPRILQHTNPDGSIDVYEEMPANRYYTDPETAEIANEIKGKPELRLLFDAARKTTPEQMKMIAKMVEGLVGEND